MPLLFRLSELLMWLALLCWMPVQAQNATPAGSPQQDSPTSASPKHVPSQWSRLRASEREALAPLAERWGEISETQRSKWLAIARNFHQLSSAEQQVMQARMKEWVALSPVQRNQARLNFNSLQSVSKDQKKSRWDEYQALSDEEKRKFSAAAMPAPSKTTAPSPRPTASDRLVQPALRTVPAAALPARAPIDKNTLLPVPGTSAENPAAPASEPVRDASAP